MKGGTRKPISAGRGMEPTGRAGDGNRRLATLLVLVFFAVQLTRLVQVRSATGETPFLSANDRSRWCTIAALGIEGTYQIDRLLEIRDPETRRRNWYTIDLVRHLGRDGRLHYYSSKPTLLPTLYAGVYIAVRNLTGWTLMGEPFLIVPLMLAIVNLLPLSLFYWGTIRWMQERFLRESTWGTVAVGMFLCWGCFLSTFTTTLNNHLPAAMATGVALWCLDRMVLGDVRARWFALCGLASALAAANELPALAWLAAAGGLCAWFDFRKAVVWWLPATLPVVLGAVGTNYMAHGTWKPAYAHRGAGEYLGTIALDRPPATLDQAVADPVWRERLIAALRQAGYLDRPEASVRVGRRPGTLEVLDEASGTHLAIVWDEPSGRAAVHRWGDWYDYPGSYWTAENKRGIDRGEPSRIRYALHFLVGHHGIFSLTPFWLLAVWGTVRVLRTPLRPRVWLDRQFLVGLAIVAVSITVLVFYIVLRGQEDRNYGGIASGPRWTFWMIPLWLYLSGFALQRLEAGGRWPQRGVEVLIAWSSLSACWAWNNPWSHPWLYQWWLWMGWGG
ncbi:MAG: hypothetical protein D6753_10560 [Planctomycetota bacterium]|nr:MAG: hypothetical protein D6753_10560 [Planctomycetota bacterium]